MSPTPPDNGRKKGSAGPMKRAAARKTAEADTAEKESRPCTIVIAGRSVTVLSPVAEVQALVTEHAGRSYGGRDVTVQTPDGPRTIEAGAAGAVLP